MKLLFKDINELREQASFIYKTQSIDNFKSDLIVATEDIISIVGEDIYKYAVSAYEEKEPSDINKELISLFRYPIAMLASLSFAKNTDISHEDTGRKVKISDDAEKIPWEWQIANDNQAMLDKGNRGIDRLIEFLDKNIEEFPNWKDSEQRKGIASLFIKSAKEFDVIVPIDSSRLFYQRVLPFIRKEDKNLAAYIGADRYKELKEAMKADKCTEEQKELIALCREIIPHQVMAVAVRRLAVQVLPHSVVMRFTSSTGTMKASTPVTAEMIASIERSYAIEANNEIMSLQAYITKTSPKTSQSVKYKSDPNDKHFSL